MNTAIVNTDTSTLVDFIEDEEVTLGGAAEHIVAVHTENDQSWCETNIATLVTEATAQDTAEQIAATDDGFVRVSEDLIDVLIDKEVIALADLPQAAQDKYNARKALRS